MLLFVAVPASPSTAQTTCPASGYPYYGNASYYGGYGYGYGYPYGGYGGYGGYGYGYPYGGYGGYGGYGYGYPYGGYGGYGGYGYGYPYGGGYYGGSYPYYGGYGGAYGVGALYGSYGYGGVFGYPYYGAYPAYSGYPSTIPYYGGTYTFASPPSSTATPSLTVSITSVGFSPNPGTVAVGQTVRWTNNDTTIHTSTSDTRAWDSGCLSPGQSYAFTFTGRGTYTYFDMVNGQRATITVN
jgi:plastocyanin